MILIMIWIHIHRTIYHTRPRLFVKHSSELAYTKLTIHTDELSTLWTRLGYIVYTIASKFDWIVFANYCFVDKTLVLKIFSLFTVEYNLKVYIYMLACTRMHACMHAKLNYRYVQ